MGRLLEIEKWCVLSFGHGPRVTDSYIAHDGTWGKGSVDANITGNRMHERTRLTMQTRQIGAVVCRLVSAVLLLACATTAPASADDDPPKATPPGETTKAQQSGAAVTEPSQDPASQPAERGVRRPVIRPLREAQGRTTTKSGCGDKGKPGLPTPSPDGPQPRWVCKEQTLTGEPVWTGKNAEFTFEIANEGEGDLQIKLKGG